MYFSISIMSVGKRRHPPSSLSSGVTPLVRAKALPERTEAPAGLAFQVSLPYAGRTWVDPARRACPTSAGASARRRRRLNAPEIQVRVNVSLRVRAGMPAHPGSYAGEDAHPLRRIVRIRRAHFTSLRMQAGTPAHPGSHAGGDAHPLRRIVRIRRAHFTSLRMQAGTPAHPGSHAGGDARAPRLACGRGRPRTQDAYGSIILHIALNAQSP
jgi:hypothetical protein